jgi:antitoxin component HigA of HigAB toxin-antitoxin module
MNEELDGAVILEGVMEIFNQDGENATDLECCYQILDYLKRALETK